MNTFFPTQIAGQIFTWAIITTGLFWFLIARSVDAEEIGVSSKRSAKRGLAILLVAWLVCTILVARAGTYRLDQGAFIPNLILSILIPTGIGSLALLWNPFRTVISGVPQYWLAGTHGLRILFGYAFIACYELGELPASFAFPVGYGDIVSGGLGILAAYYVFRRHRLATTFLVVWNVFGIADFLTAIPTGLAVIAPDAPFQGFYPFYLIPGFVVPLFLLLHVYSIHNLIRNAKQRDLTELGSPRSSRFGKYLAPHLSCRNHGESVSTT